MRSTLQRLQQQLSDAGIAPKYLLRITAELQDHYDDLRLEALAADKSPLAAAAEARSRLGPDEVIAREFLARPELRSWVYRCPPVLFVLGMVACFVIIVLTPLQGLARGRAAIARYGVAVVASAMLLSATLFVMQLAITPRLDALPRAADAQNDLRFPLERLSPAGPPHPIGEAGHPDVTRPFGTMPPPEEPDLPQLSADAERSPGSLVLAGVLEEAFEEFHFSDYLPIVKVAPIYPSAALDRRLSGYVVVEFTVARSGAVKDVVVLESSDTLFERPAVEAASKFKYRPRIVDGMPVEVMGVRNRITFEIPA